MTPETLTDISPTAGSWQDIDITTYVGSDAGNVAGVVVRVINTSATEYSYGLRNNGSTDTLTGVIEDVGWTQVIIGVDSSDIFEAYIENASVEIHIEGYILDSEAGFLTNATDKTLGTTTTWTDIDISSDTGTDTAKAACFLVYADGGTTAEYGFRKNASTDTRPGDMFTGDLRGALMATDTNEIVEGYRESTNVEFYLVGWIKDNMTSFTNASSYVETTTASFQDMDTTGDVPAGNNGIFWQMLGTSSFEGNYNIRAKGATQDEYWDISDVQYGWVEIDGDRYAQQKIQSASQDTWVWGYTNLGSTPEEDDFNVLFFGGFP